MKLSSTERYRQILDRVSQKEISVLELVRYLDVSEMTIRRDLAMLENQGKLVRTHGGAISSQRLAYEFSFKEKDMRNVEAKKHIGTVAAKLIKPDDVVFIDTGTTALAVARALRSHCPRVIITTNLCVASEFVGEKNTRVLVPGGELSPHSPDLYGEWTQQTLATVHVDVAFLGCDAIDGDGRFYASDTRGAAVSKLMITRSQQCYVVADSSKFGRRAMCQVGMLANLGGVVTDSGLSDKYRKEFNKAGIRVIQ